MVPSSFSNYFSAMVGAGGALIGLLLVAISIHPERTLGSRADAQRQAVAANAFSAMVNAFFVSAAGLIPGRNVIGPITLARVHRHRQRAVAGGADETPDAAA